MHHGGRETPQRTALRAVLPRGPWTSSLASCSGYAHIGTGAQRVSSYYIERCRSGSPAGRIHMSYRPAVSIVSVLVTLLAWACLPTTTFADDVGVIKVSKGNASIERSGQRLPVPVGAKVQVGDVGTTGADGPVGITFNGNSLLSIGACSSSSLDGLPFHSRT